VERVDAGTFGRERRKSANAAKKLHRGAISIWFFAEKRATSPAFG
jgi:hypothetical protein